MNAIIWMSLLCFAVGFGLSWIQWRRRIRRRMAERVYAELQNRMAAEVADRLAAKD